MLNVVLTTKKSKSKIVDRFIRSRGIEKFIPLFDSSHLFDTLLTTDSCNLHVFDFMFDLGTINTIRDFRDKISTLNVYVTGVEAAKAYLALTDNVFIIPDVYDILSWFWDSDACKASNVMAFDAMGNEFCRVINPSSEGKTKSLSVEIGMQNVPLKYVTADGRAVSTEGPQLVLRCKSKSGKFDLRALATRDQEEVYNHKQRSLADLPAGAIPEQVTGRAENRTQSVNGALFAEVKQKEQAEVELTDETTEVTETIVQPDAPTLMVDEKRGLGLFSRDKKPKKRKKPSAKQVVNDESYVSFGNFSAGTQGAGYSANDIDATKIIKEQRLIEDRYDSISAFCVAKGYISADDCARLGEGLESDVQTSKDDKWGNLALAEGLITEEQLIQAIMVVKNMGVLTWDEIKDLKPDFSTFKPEVCKKYRFFKLEDEDPTSDRVTLIYASSLSRLNPELYRMYDNPIPKVTLDCYIDRMLKEYET